MRRRDFLLRTGLTLSASALAGARSSARSLPRRRAGNGDEIDWDDVRNEFLVTRDKIHMSGFLLSSHPTPVREAIERHRQGLDENPADYLHEHQQGLEAGVLAAAAHYFAVEPEDFALTDSTTMGLGLLYGGLSLRAGQEILSTVHDHYATETSLRLRAERTGAKLRQIALYRDLETVSKAEIAETLAQAVRPETRIVAVTWVHSSTGLKLPIRELADALAEVNKGRAEEDRALLCVDGVHGLGVEDVEMKDLGCDFFIAGTHKWLFGPRGTGIVWGGPAAWPIANATIPTFDMRAYLMWMKFWPQGEVPPPKAMTPGGFHSFEHRWSVGEAFRFHEQIGKDRIAARIHALNTRMKDGLSETKGVTLHTPRSPELSAGIVCFEVDGVPPLTVVQRLAEKSVIASVTPYATLYARLSPCLLTSEEDVDRTLAAVRGLRG